MKTASLIACCLWFPSSPMMGGELANELAEIHREASTKLADEQDELSADVQQLVIEQTIPKVIELFEEVEGIMDETTDRLADTDTGGETIAAQTEVIEKIHAAARERQSQGGSGQSGSAMMDMMERMMGKNGEEGKKGGEKGDKPGDQAGEGASGLSDSANEGSGNGGEDGKSVERRVPKSSGSAGLQIPQEFNQAFDAYNRGVEQKIKCPTRS